MALLAIAVSILLLVSGVKNAKAIVNGSNKCHFQTELDISRVCRLAALHTEDMRGQIEITL